MFELIEFKLRAELASTQALGAPVEKAHAFRNPSMMASTI
jgi:hypothetical protein